MATSETRYFRSDQHTINTLTAYKLQTINSTTFAGVEESTNEDVTAYWGIRVWKIDSVGNETELTVGIPVAQVSRLAGSGNTEGEQSNTWDCPETALAITDAIVVRVYIKLGEGAWVQKTTHVTLQSQDWDSPTQLDGATWTVVLYTKRSWDSKLSTCQANFHFGNSEEPMIRNSRITSFTWSGEAPPPPAILRRLLVGVGL